MSIPYLPHLQLRCRMELQAMERCRILLAMIAASRATARSLTPMANLDAQPDADEVRTDARQRSACLARFSGVLSALLRRTLHVEAAPAVGQDPPNSVPQLTGCCHNCGAHDVATLRAFRGCFRIGVRAQRFEERLAICPVSRLFGVRFSWVAPSQASVHVSGRW
jgi:hypothetical protein